MKSDIKIVLVVLGIIAFVSILIVSQLGRSSPEIASPPATTEEESQALPSESETAPIMIQNWELSNLRYKITEKNEVWWKFSWQVTVENNTSHIMDFYITVNFVDRQGFIIGDDIENPPVFGPKERRVIKGYALIDTSLAPDVRKAEAEILYAFIQD